MMKQRKGVKKKTPLTREIREMIQDILASDLRPVEKAFFVFEWILREEKPNELAGKNLNEFADKARAFLENNVATNLRQTALKEAQEILGTRSDAESFHALAALSYYSYIDDEFVYDRISRKELLAKISELGVDLSKIENLHKRWTRIAGTSGDLFNKVFQKSSAEAH
jgi:hypothetical protein